MARKKHSEFFNLLHGALKEGVEALETGRKLTVREAELPDPPQAMPAKEIVALRSNRLGVSQRVFAAMLNASPQTVHAWEQGRKKPSGIALRLLRLVESQPRILSRTRVGRPARGSSSTSRRQLERAS